MKKKAATRAAASMAGFGGIPSGLTAATRQLHHFDGYAPQQRARAVNWIWVFLNGARGEICTRALHKSGHKIGALVVPPEKKDQFTTLAVDVGAELEAPHDVNAIQWIREQALKQPRIALVAGFSTIFRDSLLSVFEEGVINLHAGRVPEYRGGSPLNWQIINGEREIGLSVLRMVCGIDDGPTLATSSFSITENDDIAAVHGRANIEFSKMICATFAAIDSGKARETPQDNSRARYWLQRSDMDGAVRWADMTAQRVHNLVRAITRPYPGAHSGDIRIWKTSIPRESIHGPPGRVGFIQGRGPFVCCADRAILLSDYEGSIKAGMTLF